MSDEYVKGTWLVGGQVSVHLAEEGGVVLQLREGPQDADPLNVPLPPHAAERLGRALLEAAADGERLQRYRLRKGRA